MAADFRDYFVGEKGYEALKKLMKSGNDFCIDVAKCLQERTDAEAAYVKTLRKNSDTLQKLAGRAKGTLAQAFTTLAAQTSKESDAHSVIANTLLNEISIPMKNLAETQVKERKLIEDTLNGKFKEWNNQKDVDDKYRTRQFEKSREIETLTSKITELSSGIKSSVKSKASSVSSPLVRCVLPGGRNTTASEKLTSNSDMKHQTNLEISITKAEEDLKKIERKYHTATRDVELLRQACDLEMYRSCDQLQKMELDRITEMASFIQTYTISIEALSTTMQQVTTDLYTIQIIPTNDIILQAKSNVQSNDIEILLYDIYAENESCVMDEYRRKLSLLHWIEVLSKDIQTEQQTRNEKKSFVSPRTEKSNEDESPDDDRGSSSDGAMCSSQKDIVLNSVHHRDGSSSSSNDDDGAMHHTKREKKKKEVGESFSSEIFIDRRSADLLEHLYRASLYKIQKVYNHIRNEPEPRSEYTTQLAKTYNDKGHTITLLHLPAQSLTPPPPPSAPSTTKHFVQAMPMYVPAPTQQQTMLYSAQTQAPPVGWAVNAPQFQCAAPDERMVQAEAPYPVLGAQAPPRPNKIVRALYSYKAKHADELNLKPGDIIVLLGRRKDDWCEGISDGKTGLFPGNYVEDA